MEEGRCPACGKAMASSLGHLCSDCSLSGWNLGVRDSDPDAAVTEDLLAEVPKQPRKKRRRDKGYTQSQVVAAAGRAVVAVGTDDLPLEGQREALELASSWLVGLKD